MNDMVTCMECGKEFKRVTYKHLKHHNITLDEYIVKYPNAKLISDSTTEGLKTNSLERFVKKYGIDDGAKKYEEYKQFQSSKNTFEYKQKKYGWTEEQFSAFNNSRAVTKENLIKKHGAEKGLIVWDSYVEKQRTNGNTLDWYIEKYGSDGEEKYKQLNLNKRLILPNFIKKYGVLVGCSKFYDYLETKSDIQSNIGYSNIESEFVDHMIDIFPKNYVIHHCKNNQFSKWCHETNAIKMYDFVISSPIKLCIEFNGDYWHCNPTKYSVDYMHPHSKISAKEIWDRDKQKHNLIEQHGYNVHIVWEHDWLNNKDKCINDVKNIHAGLLSNE
jgi:G:T-mismatch repair DNA endonuclease (very short patch repair protein)